MTKGPSLKSMEACPSLPTWLDVCVCVCLFHLLGVFSVSRASRKKNQKRRKCNCLWMKSSRPPDFSPGRVLCLCVSSLSCFLSGLLRRKNKELVRVFYLLGNHLWTRQVWNQAYIARCLSVSSPKHRLPLGKTLLLFKTRKQGVLVEAASSEVRDDPWLPACFPLFWEDLTARH